MYEYVKCDKCHEIRPEEEVKDFYCLCGGEWEEASKCDYCEEIITDRESSATCCCKDCFAWVNQQIVNFAKKDDSSKEVEINTTLSYFFSSEEINEILLNELAKIKAEKIDTTKYTKEFINNEQLIVERYIDEV